MTPSRVGRRAVAATLVAIASISLPFAVAPTATASDDFDFRVLDEDGNVIAVDGSPGDDGDLVSEIDPPSLPSLASTVNSGVARYVLVIADANPEHLELTLAAIANAGGLVETRHDSIGSAYVLITGDQAADLADHPWIAAIDVNRGVGLLDGSRVERAVAVGGDVVPGRYIVRLSDSASPAQRVAVAADLAGRVVDTFDQVFDGWVVDLTEAQVSELKTRPGVADIEPDRIITLDTVTESVLPAATQTGATWGVDRIDQVSLPLDGSYTDRSNGAGVTAYIIDTGVAAHSEFGARLASGIDTYDNDADATDCHGHGTHVAGTVGGTTYGVADGTTIVPVKVFGCSGSTSTSIIVAGINWVLTQHTPGDPAVANLSLGGGASSSMDAGVRSLVDAGIITAVAAGNSSNNACYYSPAREPSVITVGSTTNTDTRSGFSNYGSCLDIFAPGSSITSAWHTGGTNTISGTSMASPHVAGAAAAIWGADITATYSEVENALLSSFTAGLLTDRGPDSPDALLYINPNDGGDSDATAPDAPTGVTATLSDTTATIAWSAPADDGGATITRYVASAVEDDSFTCVWTSGPLQCDITSLAPGTFTFTVLASNSAGVSTASAASNGVTVSAGTNNDYFVASMDLSGNSGSVNDSNADATFETGEPPIDAGSGRATIWFSWTAPDSGRLTVDTFGSNFDTVLAVYSGSSLPSLTRLIYNDDSRQTDTYFQSTVTLDVTSGTEYHFRVNRYGSTGGDVTLNWEFATVGVPTAPTDVEGLAVADGQVQVRWAGSEAVPPVTGYTVTSNPDGLTCSWTAGPKLCTVTGLTTGTSYTFTVTATNSSGPSPSSSPSAAVTASDPGSDRSWINSWGQDRVDQASNSLDGVLSTRGDASVTNGDADRGSGSVIFVVDTGVSAHDDFGARLTTGRDIVDGDNDASDCEGHGTHVASTAAGTNYGIATRATIVPVRVLDCWGSGTTSGVVEGLEWVADYDLAGKQGVVNMSLGGGASDALDAAVENLVDAGIVVVVAAGNSNDDACYYSPAREPTAITVGATSSDDQRSYFSNIGSCVDIFAPGSSIEAASITGTSDTETLSGTSMAAPHVAGAAALVRSQYPNASAHDVAAMLIADGRTGVVGNRGSDSPDRFLNVETTIYDLTAAPATTVTGVTATAGVNSVTVSWTAVSPSATPAATAPPVGTFTVTASPSGSCTAPYYESSCTISGLSSGTTYTFSVAPAGLGKTGVVSESATAVPSAPPSSGGGGGGGSSGGGGGGGGGSGGGGGGGGSDDSPVSTLQAIAPNRLFDTRTGQGGIAPGRIGDGRVLEMPVLGRGGVPASGVAAVSLNVTATNTGGPGGWGYLTVYPCDSEPRGSTLNFTAGRTVANAVIAPLSAAGTICFSVFGQADVIADVSGAILSGSGFVPTAPTRVVDTRGSGPIGGERVLEVGLLGVAGIPASGVAAVSMNVTVTNTLVAGSGYATVYPCGARPNASNLNFGDGQTVANAVVTPLSASGTACVYVYGSADVLIDVNGAFLGDSGFGPTAPTRLADTRSPGQYGLAANSIVEVQVTGRAGVPAGASVASLTVTLTNTTAAGGYATVYPCGTRYEASNLNFSTGDTVANAVIAPLSPSGRVCVFVYGRADVLVDVSGYLP